MGREDGDQAPVGVSAPSRPAHVPGDAVSVIATSSTVSLRDRFAVGGADVTIGRDHGCTIYLYESNVSRRHARIVSREDGHWIVDTSANGTYVNGERLSAERRLVVGDHIRIHTTILECHFGEDADALYELAAAKVAFEDVITGLPTPRVWLPDIAQTRARQGVGPPVVAVMIDAFLTLCDEEGGHFADGALRHVADVLRDALPAGATLARASTRGIGVALASNDPEVTAAFVEDLRARFASGEVEIDGQRAPMSIVIRSLPAAINDRAVYDLFDPRPWLRPAVAARAELSSRLPPPLPAVLGGTPTRWVRLQIGAQMMIAYAYDDEAMGPSAKGGPVSDPPTPEEIQTLLQRSPATFRDPKSFGAQPLDAATVNQLGLPAEPPWMTWASGLE